MTCWSCSHVRRDGADRYGIPMLWCDTRQVPAKSRCWKFDYEPGSDEGERSA